MKKVTFIIIVILLIPTIVSANIICNDGTVSNSCQNCHRGCCSHHGGCASNGTSTNSTPTTNNTQQTINNSYQKNTTQQVT